MSDQPWLEFGLTTEQVEAARRYWAERFNEPFESVPWQVAIPDYEFTEAEWAECCAYAEQLVAEGR